LLLDHNLDKSRSNIFVCFLKSLCNCTVQRREVIYNSSFALSCPPSPHPPPSPPPTPTPPTNTLHFPGPYKGVHTYTHIDRSHKSQLFAVVASTLGDGYVWDLVPPPLLCGLWGGGVHWVGKNRLPNTQVMQ
jgi:hypothetical protein